MEPIDCWIYKSPRKDEMYLYVPGDQDFSRVPDALLRHFGDPLFVMALTLQPGRRLARVVPEDVVQQLRERGYFLQMPPAPHERPDRKH